MDLLKKIASTEGVDQRGLIDPAERYFEELMRRSVMPIASSMAGSSGSRINFIDTAIGDPSMIDALQNLLSVGAERILGPFKDRSEGEDSISSPLLVEAKALPGRVYGAVHRSNPLTGNSVRFTAATAEAAAVPQFYESTVYQFNPQLGFFGHDAQAILGALIQQNGNDSDVVRNMRKLIQLVGCVLDKKIVGQEEVPVFRELAGLMMSIGRAARDVIEDLERRHHSDVTDILGKRHSS